MTPREFCRWLRTQPGFNLPLVLSMYDRLNKDYESFMEVFADPLDPVPLEQTLDEYLGGLPNQLDGANCIQAVREAGHEEVLEALYRTFFKRVDNKKWCIWLCGQRSSGKSSVIRLLEEIFSCEPIVWQRNMVTTSGKNKAWPTQICTCEEFAWRHALDGDMLDKTLQLLEGRGGDIRNNFYTKYTPKQYKHTFFLVASNQLPDMASEAQKNTDAHKYQWLPIESRTDIVILQESFAGTTNKLPYNAH